MFSAGFRCRRQVRDQKSHGYVADLIDLSQHVEIDLAGLRLFCRKQILSWIEAVEYRKRQERRLSTAADQ